jgi:hypothetical protein
VFASGRVALLIRESGCQVTSAFMELRGIETPLMIH